MIRSKSIYFFLALILLQQACKDKYVSPYASPTTGYLVVEGYICGNDSTSFHLTRTVKLPGDDNPPAVTGANLEIEGSDNTVYPLTEKGTGYYGASTLPLVASKQYRLHIRTPDGLEYQSAYVTYRPTPAIDSISWKENPDNTIQISASTHDPADTTRYYFWEYGETWEYHAGEQSYEVYDPSTKMVYPRADSNQIYRCWHYDSSTAILLYSTAKLSKDVVDQFPLVTLPANSAETSVEYSIHVRQYALSKDGYNYMVLMQKNTESLGSIFDAQPSALTGNITCISNTSVPVIGWVSAGTMQQQRIFINRTQVISYYTNVCPIADTTFGKSTANYVKFFEQEALVPIEDGVAGITANTSGCVDCTTQGGITQKPSYWP